MSSKKGGASIKNMHILFGAASVILVGATIYAFVQDYRREFTKYQDQYYKLELTRLELEQKNAESELQEADYKEEVDAVTKKKEEGKAARDAHAKDIDTAKAEIAKIDNKLQLAARQLNFTSAEYDTTRYELDAARTEHKSDAEVQRLASKLSDLEQAKASKLAEKVALEEDKAAKQKVIDDAENELKEADKLLALLEADDTDVTAKIKKAKGSKIINALKDAPGINFIDPNYKYNQVVMKELPVDVLFAKTQRVDRCAVCHVTIDNPDPLYSERDPEKRKALKLPDIPAVLRSHPNLELFVGPNSKHPWKKGDNSFGCTICHQGKPMGTTFTRAAHSPQNPKQGEEWEKKYGWEYLHYWDNKMLPLQHTEATCLKCHKGLDEVPEAHKLNEGRQLFRERGCANCHMGASGDKDFAWVGRIGPDLRRIGEKTDLNWARNWIENPWTFRPSTKMPRFFGLENRIDKDMDFEAAGKHCVRDKVEVEAIATYLFTTSKLREKTPAAPPSGDVEAGRQLFSSVGCLGCHSTHEVKDKYEFNQHGPDLSRIGFKVTPGWLFEWLKAPRHYWAETKMPNLRLSDKEAADLASYLLSTMKAGNAPPQAESAGVEAFDAVLTSKLSATTPSEELKAKLAKPMEMLEQSLKLKVKYASHNGKIIDTGEGEWTEAQIAKIKEIVAADKNPERLAKAFYTGETLIQHHGCFGCHNIQGWTFSPLTCVNLNGEADKDLEKLDFGKTLNDHSIGHTRWDWFYTKIARPRVYDMGKLELIKPFDRLRMPWFGYAKLAKTQESDSEGGSGAGEHEGALHPDANKDESTSYGLNERQIERLVTHILSLTMEQVPAEKVIEGQKVAGAHTASARDITIDRGRRVVRELNCTGCHLVGLNENPIAGAEPLPRKIPLEALVALLTPECSRNIGQPGQRVYLDEDVVSLNYSDGKSEFEGYLNALRGTYITDITAPIIMAEKKVRANSVDPYIPVGFHMESKGKKDWAKYGDLVSEDRFIEITAILFPDTSVEPDHKSAKAAYARLSKKSVEKAAYERLAGSDALRQAPNEDEKLTSLQVENRKVAKEYYEPTMIKVRFARGEGRLINHLVDFEKEHGVENPNQQQAPPSLSFEGGKVQPGWLYEFLHNVYGLRPGLHIRMPSFWTDGPFSKYKAIYPAGHLSAVNPLTRDTSIAGEPLPTPEAPTIQELPDDAAQIDEFFVADSREKPFGHQPGPLLSTDDKALYTKGQDLVFKEAKNGGMGCIECHSVGNFEQPVPKWAPNLVSVKRRLREDWVHRFLVFPAAVYPWANMPSNFHFDWDKYSYTNGQFRGLQEDKEENLKDWSEKLNAVQYYLLHTGEAEIGMPQK